jgi:5-methylcytosine-specific restriction endonuclease McrA
MKKIEIQGKRNHDKMKQQSQPDAIIERTVSKKWTFSDAGYEPENQLAILQGTRNVDTDGTEEPSTSFLRREIEKKLKGYKTQDNAHVIYDEQYFIDVDAVIQLMTDCKLACHYCGKICAIIYRETLFRTQWTLDRINNNHGHNRENVVIACLECNLRRGTMDSERFRQGKQMTFTKKDA